MEHLLNHLLLQALMDMGYELPLENSTIGAFVGMNEQNQVS